MRKLGEYLQDEPLRHASGLYEENTRLEQTHADIIVKTSQELTKPAALSSLCEVLQEDDAGQQYVMNGFSARYRSKDPADHDTEESDEYRKLIEDNEEGHH